MFYDYFWFFIFIMDFKDEATLLVNVELFGAKWHLDLTEVLNPKL